MSTALPPIPALDQAHFSFDRIQTPLGAQAALIPAAAPYLCADKNAPALLLIPGLGMDGLGFVRQLPLGAQLRLYFFQTPNEPAPGETGLAQFARHIEEYILARGLDQDPRGLWLGGASMGGALTLCIAIRKRVKLRGLILYGTFGSCQHLPGWQRFFAPLAYLIPSTNFRLVARRLTGRTHRLNDVDARWLAQPYLRRTRRYFGRAVMALTRQEQLEAARQLDLPALVIHGDRDTVLPLAAGTELGRILPRSRMRVIQGARHLPFFTHAEEVNTETAEFIAQHAQN